MKLTELITNKKTEIKNVHHQLSKCNAKDKKILSKRLTLLREELKVFVDYKNLTKKTCYFCGKEIKEDEEYSQVKCKGQLHGYIHDYCKDRLNELTEGLAEE